MNQKGKSQMWRAVSVIMPDCEQLKPCQDDISTIIEGLLGFENLWPLKRMIVPLANSRLWTVGLRPHMDVQVSYLGGRKQPFVQHGLSRFSISERRFRERAIGNRFRETELSDIRQRYRRGRHSRYRFLCEKGGDRTHCKAKCLPNLAALHHSGYLIMTRNGGGS